MAGQVHRDDGPGRPPGVEPPPARSLDHADRALFRALCADLERWFPDRFDRAVVEDIVTSVLVARRTSATAALAEATSTHSRRSLLMAAAKREAVDRLSRDPALLRLVDAGEEAGDDAFARDLFGGSVTARSLVWAMRRLVSAGRVEEFRIVTQYLDMAYLDGRAPDSLAVATRLCLPVPAVRAALDGLRRLLAERPADR